jgi:hypothetical protein
MKNEEIVYKKFYKYHCPICKQQFKRTHNRDKHIAKCNGVKNTHTSKAGRYFGFYTERRKAKNNMIKTPLIELFGVSDLNNFSPDEIFLINYFADFNINSFSFTPLQYKRLINIFRELPISWKFKLKGNNSPRLDGLILQMLETHIKRVVITKNTKQ